MGIFDALNGEQGQQPGVPEIGPPQTPEELQARKGMWQQVFAKISEDPNLRQAVMLGGLQMMQNKSSSLGEGIAQGIGTGVKAYSAGQESQAKQQMAAEDLQMRRESHAVNMDKAKSGLATAEADRQWQAKVRPLELQKLQSEIDALPISLETEKVKNDLAKLKLQNEPRAFEAELQKIRAQIGASNASAAASMASASRANSKTDSEQGIDAYMNLPNIKSLPVEQQRAAATRAYLQDSRGMSSQFRAEAADQEAVNLYRAYMDAVARDDQTSLILSFGDADTLAKVQRGKSLVEGGAVANPKTPDVVSAPGKLTPAKPAISVYRDEKTGELVVNHQMASGKIGE